MQVPSNAAVLHASLTKQTNDLLAMLDQLATLKDTKALLNSAFAQAPAQTAGLFGNRGLNNDMPNLTI